MQPIAVGQLFEGVMIEVALDVWWEGIPGEAEGKGVHVPGVWGKERRPVPPGTLSLPFYWPRGLCWVPWGWGQCHWESRSDQLEGVLVARECGQGWGRVRKTGRGCKGCLGSWGNSTD